MGRKTRRADPTKINPKQKSVICNPDEMNIDKFGKGADVDGKREREVVEEVSSYLKQLVYKIYYFGTRFGA